MTCGAKCVPIVAVRLASVSELPLPPPGRRLTDADHAGVGVQAHDDQFDAGADAAGGDFELDLERNAERNDLDLGDAHLVERLKLRRRLRVSIKHDLTFRGSSLCGGYR
ncbi:MAG: hypothetical protein WDN48_10080 [Pseudolabrys sp.]